MLLRQYLGGHHESPLVATSYRSQERGGGHHGLPAAYLPLKQPAHRHRLCDIGKDLLQDSRLSLGQVEGKGADKGLQDFALGLNLVRRAAHLPISPPGEHPQLYQEELIEG